MTLYIALYWFAQAVRGSNAEDSDVTVDVCGVDGCSDGSPDSRDYQSDGLGEDDNSSASENAKVLDWLDGGAPRKRRKIADTGAPTVAPWNR